MKKHLNYLQFALIAVIIALSACSSSPESKLIGSWKATDVKVDFDEQKASPQMIEQVVEREKQTILKFTSDSTLNIIEASNTHRTKWKLDEEDKIWFSFEGDGSAMNELGIYEDGKIKAISSTALGSIEITYSKQ